MGNTIKRLMILVMAITAAMGRLYSAEPFALDYEATFITGAGKGDFAPYYLNANRHGLITQSANAVADLRLGKQLDLSRRFSYGFGAEAAGGWTEPTTYETFRYDQRWTDHDMRPAAVRLQQLFGEIKWRGVFLTVGMKNHESALLNFRLSSGDLIESGNARAIPEARIGFIDFQDIPFTSGWVQLQGEIGYGKFTDKHWNFDHYNYFNQHITEGSWINYKRWYFRTKPTQPLSVTVGAQCSNIFGGTAYSYRHGELWRTRKSSCNARDFIEAFLPLNDRETFRYGNSLGSWDLKARYRLKSGHEVSAYFQWPWEDGSGMAKRNGWDGLWGLEYKAPRKGWIDGAVVEYIDFSNQSGPLHWSPTDRPGTTVTGKATGGDDYYNNVFSNSYTNYGLSIGTPFVKAPYFNLDGSPVYTGTRLRGFHAAAEGHPHPRVEWRAAVSYRKAWGNGKIILPEPQHTFSMLLEAGYSFPQVRGLSVSGAFALDQGNMFGNNVGAEVRVRYSGVFTK